MDSDTFHPTIRGKRTTLPRFKAAPKAANADGDDVQPVIDHSHESYDLSKTTPCLMGRLNSFISNDRQQRPVSDHDLSSCPHALGRAPCWKHQKDGGVPRTALCAGLRRAERLVRLRRELPWNFGTSGDKHQQCAVSSIKQHFVTLSAQRHDLRELRQDLQVHLRKESLERDRERGENRPPEAQRHDSRDLRQGLQVHLRMESVERERER